MSQLKIVGGTIQMPSGAITNDNISGDSGAEIDADKLQHVYKPGTNFDLAIGGTPATREEIVFVASTAGTIRAFHALLNDTGTATSVSFDLKVNGSSVLSATVDITHSTSDRDVVDGTISSPSLAVGDVVSIAMTATSTTGAQGPFAWAEIEELAA